MDGYTYLINELNPASAGWYPAGVARVLLSRSKGWREADPDEPAVEHGDHDSDDSDGGDHDSDDADGGAESDHDSDDADGGDTTSHAGGDAGTSKKKE